MGIIEKGFSIEKNVIAYEGRKLAFLVINSILLKHHLLQPVIEEYSAIDSQTFKHACFVKDIASNSFQEFLLNTNIQRRLGINEIEKQYYLDALDLATFFHDIGKCGVVVNDIPASIRLFSSDPSQSNSKILSLNADLRTNQVKAQQSIHPLIGGYMWRQIANEFLDSNSKIAHDVSDLIFRHHEQDPNGKSKMNSYPRNGFRTLRNSSLDLVYAFLCLSDIASAMTEPRHRQKRVGVFSLEEIKTELVKFPLAPSLKQYQEEIVNLVMKNLFSIYPIVSNNDPFEMGDGKTIIGRWNLLESENVPILKMAIKNIWSRKKISERLLATIAGEQYHWVTNRPGN